MLTKLDDVIEALGGDRAVQALTDSKVNNLHNWRYVQRRFPARLYLIMTTELAARGKFAKPELWGIESP